MIDEGNWLIYDREDAYQEFEIIKFHTYVHPISIDMYVDGEFYSLGTQVSINENADYMEYRLEMPKKAVTVEFKTDMVGCSSFLMLNPWLGMPYQYVTELTVEQGYVGVSPDTEPQIVTYTNASKIAKIKSALCDMPVYQVREDSELAAEIEGGAYIKYTFRTETESYELYVANRRIVAENNVYLVYGEYPL